MATLICGPTSEAGALYPNTLTSAFTDSQNGERHQAPVKQTKDKRWFPYTTDFPSPPPLLFPMGGGDWLRKRLPVVASWVYCFSHPDPRGTVAACRRTPGVSAVTDCGQLKVADAWNARQADTGDTVWSDGCLDGDALLGSARSEWQL